MSLRMMSYNGVQVLNNSQSFHNTTIRDKTSLRIKGFLKNEFDRKDVQLSNNVHSSGKTYYLSDAILKRCLCGL